jgi:hypothetical protein
MGGAIYRGERPFTAVFFGSQVCSSFSSEDRSALHSQFDLGIIGPAALGEQEQKGIHKGLNNIEPQGWENQLSQDIVLNYRCTAEKVLFMRRYFEAVPGAGIRLGTLYTDAILKLNTKTGIFQSSFSLPDVAVTRRANFQLYLVAKGALRFVGYNATLQGGLLNNGNIYELSDHEISRTIAEGTIGCVAGYKKIQLEYSRSFITKEFKEGLEHSWGRCAVTLYL